MSSTDLREPRGLAPPSDFGEISRAAAVPVPLLVRISPWIELFTGGSLAARIDRA